MKSIKLMASTLMLLNLKTSAHAQLKASPTISTTIVTPTSIYKNVDMNFGNMTAYSTDGNVVLALDGTRSKTGGVVLPATTDTVTAASFNVSGQANYTYAITLPSAAVVLLNGTNTMNDTEFTFNIDIIAGLFGTDT